MAVDHQARAKLAQSTRWLVGARITNFQFDRAIPRSDDPAIREIYGRLWLLYCDLREHRLSGQDELSPAKRELAVRCILFLKSGLPYPWPVLSRGRAALLLLANLLTLGWTGRAWRRRLVEFGEEACWPFKSEAQYATALAQPVYLAG